MGHTSKARTLGYDNIAVASATGIERTIAGAVPPVFTDTYGNIENIAVASDYSADENIVVVGTNELANERLTA